MCTAARKWKQFKAKIKKLYFKSDMNIEEENQSPDSRINDDEWKFLVTYWMCEEFQVTNI